MRGRDKENLICQGLLQGPGWTYELRSPYLRAG